MKFRILSSPDKLEEWLKVVRLVVGGDVADVRSQVLESLGEVDLPRGVGVYLEDNHQIVAAAYLKRTETDDIDTFTIFHVAVVESMRRRGLGKLLMNRIFDWAGTQGMRIAFVSSVTAGPFYEKCGMIKYGEVKRITREGQTRAYLYLRLNG